MHARRLERGPPDLRRLVAGMRVDGRPREAAVLTEWPVRLDLIAAVLLGLVQRAVRLAQQRIDVEAALTLVPRHADADRHRELGHAAGGLERQRSSPDDP